MNREEFVKILGELAPEVLYDSPTARRGGIRKNDDGRWEVAFGVNIMPWINEHIEAHEFEIMTKTEARKMIKRMLDKLESIQKETIQMIRERAKV